MEVVRALLHDGISSKSNRDRPGNNDHALEENILEEIVPITMLVSAIFIQIPTYFPTISCKIKNPLGPPCSAGNKFAHKAAK